MQNTNPPLSPLVRLFAIMVTLILITGSSLFLAPNLVGPLWPWELSPFNARFLAAFYLAEMVAIVMLITVNYWAPGRLILPLSLLFTTIVSIASVLHLDQFNRPPRATWAWFIVYVGSVVISAYFVWRYRRLSPADPTPIPQNWRLYLLGQAGVLGLYGVGLLTAPLTFSAFWPWPIDSFHAQVYSAIFITIAAGSLILSRAAAPVEWLTLGLVQAVFGLFAIWGVVIVDSMTHGVDWMLPGTWFWVGAFAALFIAGLALVWRAYTQRMSALRSA